jgi:hypothetical protein
VIAQFQECPELPPQLRKFIDLGNGLGNELALQLVKKKEVKRCNINGEKLMCGTFEV